MTAEIFPPRVVRRHPHDHPTHAIFLTLLLLITGMSVASGQTCNDWVTVALGADCTAEITPDLILEGSYNYNEYSVSLSTPSGAPAPNPLTQAHIGQTIVATVTHTPSGNSCQGHVLVEDKLAPVLQCVDLFLPCAATNFQPAYLRDALDLSDAFPGVTEACGAVDLTYADTWFDLGCSDPPAADHSGYIRRVWTATDGSGNQGTCVQTLYLVRSHAADVVFPPDLTLDCANPDVSPSATGVPVLEALGMEWPLYPSAGACELSITFADQILPICSNSYKILRTWTVLDWCLPGGPGNPATSIQVVHVMDSQGPAMTCPADRMVNANPQECLADFDLPDLVLNDNCAGPAAIRAEWEVNGIPFLLEGSLQDFPGNNYWNPDTLGALGMANDVPVGAYTLRYIATDACENSSSCTFRITVTDLVPPVAACQEYKVVNLGVNGEALIDAAAFDDESYDNCSPPYFKVRRVESADCQPGSDQFYDKIKFCCSDIGDTVLVILRVYDFPTDTGAVSLSYGADHSNECEVRVTVKDKLRPVCLAPANITVDCEGFDPSLGSYGAATAADNCCLDTIYEASRNYALFDTLCNRGTIVRTFRAEDCNQLSSQCTQRVVVQYNQNYTVKFPDDLLLMDCDTTGLYYPPPILEGVDCELISISYTDFFYEASPGACVKIQRTWKVINWCTYDPNEALILVPNPQPHLDPNHLSNLPGPLVAPPGAFPSASVIRVSPLDPQPTDFSDYWHPEGNGYEYKQIITVRDETPPKVRACPVSFPLIICDQTSNDPEFYNAPYWSNASMPGVHDLCEASVDLGVTGEDACSGGDVSIRYLLFLDLDGDDSTETVVSSTNPPGFNVIRYNNANTPNYAGGEPRAFDHRPVPPEQKYGFTIQYFYNPGGFTSARMRWHTQAAPATYVAPVLPHGRHKLRWIISDGCGNENYCEYIFTVKDCQPPTVLCLDGLSANMQNATELTLFPSDFLQYVSDNCSPLDMIELSLIPSSQNTGVFPLDANGEPFGAVTFDCSDLGTQPVMLWAQDAEGNASFCETYVIVQDNMGTCGNYPVSVAGVIQTEAGEGVEDCQVALTGAHPALPPISQQQASDGLGAFGFTNALPLAADYSVTPLKNGNILNGVTTYDLVLISKHLLGQQPLTSPYKMIAADANRSQSVTVFDVLELRKLILGIYTALPNNTSWRFVDRDFVFPNPYNPFETIFPETVSLQDVQVSQMENDFMGIKVGDVNLSAISNNFLPELELRSTTPFYLTTADRPVQQGAVFELSFHFSETPEAFQTTLHHPGLTLEEVLPGFGMLHEHFAAFEPSSALTIAWDNPTAAVGGFTLRFRAQQSGRIGDMLHLSGQITAPEAYVENASDQVERRPVALRFEGASAAPQTGEAFALYPNVPNPVGSSTQIAFNLPEAGVATLDVYDDKGRVLWQQSGHFPKGYNAIALHRKQLGAHAGVVYYRLTTSAGTAVRSMVLVAP